MEVRADTVFTYDRYGRMLLTNEPDGRPAPRLFLGCTGGGYTLRFGQSESDGLVRRLTHVVDGAPRSDTAHIPSDLLTVVEEALGREGPVKHGEGGPAYRFPDTMNKPADAVELTDANRAIVREPFPWLYRELDGWAPCCVVVHDAAVVSVCFTSRLGPGVAEAGLETLPAFRGRGYAVTATAAWATAIRRTGRIPLYSTHWENLASQGVARRLGLVLYGTDLSWQ